MTFTRNSFYALFFNASEYKDTEDSYHQHIGCHLEAIIKKDPNACILFVASLWDKSKEGILRSEEKINDLYVKATRHIQDRIGGNEPRCNVKIIMPNTNMP